MSTSDMTDVVHSLTEETTRAIEHEYDEVTVPTEDLESLLVDRGELLDEIARLNEENQNLAQALEGIEGPTHTRA
jgi:hypothetical protein